MFEKITPEKAGIAGKHILDFLNHCEASGITMHSVLMMRGDKLFAEYYWAPFDKDFCHRMYSQTKSYVSVAIGLLEEEGKLCLDDTIASYFPEKIDRELPPYLKAQTIREMLTMTTCGGVPSWFTAGDPDRTHLYFAASAANHPAGTYWAYDSAGSQVLSSLVEKLSGMALFEYLNEKIFKYLGTFKTADILKTPNGDSWGDSALLCTSRDMASFARFVMNYGTWRGKRLMNEAYLRLATTKQVSNNSTGFELYNTQGYGYQIWMTQQGGFAFNGMGGQFTICVPDKDFIFVCTGDNQGYAGFGQIVFDAVFNDIVNHLEERELPADNATESVLVNLGANLKLRAVKGDTVVPMVEKINGRTYICQDKPNPQGIKRFSLHFFDNKPCEFRYTNAQGEKVIYFGMTENVFAKFPQFGYSNDKGGVRTTDGFLYDCAASAAWIDSSRLLMRVQIIDRYFGNMFANFSFKEDEVAITMASHAEDFLKEYAGVIVARQAK